MDLKDISKKRQKKWKETDLYKVKEDASKPKFYILDMFPYPSGAGLHVGHPKGYIATDTLARKKMLEGFNVLHPMGFDTFGLGTENYAIEHKMKPQDVAKQNIENYIRQLEMFGTTYDRSRSVNTADPKYFKRTQRVFLQMYNHYYDEKLKKAMPVTDPSKQERLAYVDYKPINRCPKCMTGLANEDLDDGKCERCGSVVEQKPMKQRVLRITKYAERLLEGLDTLKREESMKDLERNRIGKSEGTEFDMQVDGTDEKFSVYTTRIDTVFGMSFVAIAPEHPLVDKITTKEYQKDVEKYKEAAKHKTQLERTELQKEKTGVFCGAYAINPFNGEKVPVFVADYVLANYGTGVVMAVPAHDERDFEFAKKYKLPIKHVIGPSLGKKHTDAVSKVSGYAVFYDKKKDALLVGVETINGHKYYRMPGGTIEEGEDIISGTMREVEEETGFHDMHYIDDICCIQNFYFAHSKKVRRENNAKYLLFELNSDSTKAKKLTIHEKDCPIERIPYNEVLRSLDDMNDDMDVFDGKRKGFRFVLEMIKKNISGIGAHTEKGILFDSGEFSGLESDEAIKKMQDRLEKKGIGGVKVNYKMQDRVFSRQRYRGEPFPILRDEDGNIVALDEKDLPLELPDVDNYQPTGTEEGPLAAITDRVNVTKDGKTYKRETNTMPGRAGSSRYRLRYMDVNNEKELVEKDKEKYWGNVDVYVGGAEHVTRHMIYARFRQKFLFDIGTVTKQEPFEEYHYVGLIMGEDGRKMSKRRGNVVNPDDIINEFGTDALRTYEMFMGPFDQPIAWSTNGIKGVKKFLEKVIVLKEKISDSEEANETKILLNQSIKKLTDDIDAFRFNTAISQLMILVNHLTDLKEITKKTFEDLVILVSPFAPHLAEELREGLGNEYSVFTKATWPSYDEKCLVADTVTIGVQVNGKVRGSICINNDAEEKDALQAANSDEKIKSRITGEPKKVIYVKGKILNIVV